MRTSKAERLADEELMPLIGEKNPDAFEVFYDRHGGGATRSPTGSSASAGPPKTSSRRRSSRSGAAAPASTAPAAASAPGCSASSATGRSTRCAASAGKAPKLDFDDDAILEQRPAEEQTEAEALRRETAEEVRGALDELPGEQSKVIQLAYFGGFSHSEIAGMLGIPLGTVKGRMRLGLEKIRGELAEGLA